MGGDSGCQFRLRTMPSDADLRLEEVDREEPTRTSASSARPRVRPTPSRLKPSACPTTRSRSASGWGQPCRRSFRQGDGLAHFHAPLDASVPPRLTGAQRRAVSQQASYAAAHFPNYPPPGLRGATVVGHGSEADYARRVGGRVAQAIRQLQPTTDEAWVAIYWSNGAPIDVVHAAVPWRAIPRHIVGIILIGCGVIFGHPQIHCFTTRLRRLAGPEDSLAVRSLSPLPVRARPPAWHSRPSKTLPAFARHSLKAGRHTVLRRIGEQRILPFNLLMAGDPDDLGRNAATPPFVS